MLKATLNVGNPVLLQTKYEYNKERYWRDPDNFRRYNKERYWRDPEHFRNLSKKYREEHPEKQLNII